MSKKYSYEFVKEQIEKEGYKLLSTEYKNTSSKLKLQCDKGHYCNIPFRTFYNTNSRCKECFNLRRKYSYEFVKEQIEKEGYKLLSKEYKGNKSKLKIICIEGHEYETTFGGFSLGQRCRECFNLRRKHSYEFVKEQIEKEGYKLLSKEYKKSLSKLKLQCDKGHYYNTTFNRFYNLNQRCPECQHPSKIYSYEFVKEQIEKEGYKLLSTEYKGNKSKLKTICTKGHEWETTWNGFSFGNRCRKCSYESNIRNKTQKHSYQYIKEQIEKEGYKLLSKEYKHSHSKLKLQCNNYHEYDVKYNDFRNGCRCPYCTPAFSKSEKEITKYLKSLNIEVIENDRSIIYPLEIDIVIPEYKLAIEYCGLYWHSEEKKDKNYHKNKLELTNKAGYRLITIFEDEWINKKDIVKNRLKYILGLSNEIIYARKCIIREISKEEAMIFIDKYHIQGYINATVYLGAFYNNDIVAVNTFIKTGLYEYELNRFCVNRNVIGIASKLLKYFQRNYECKKIITFADLRWSEGNLYEKIGFTKDKILKPDYMYFKQNSKRYHKFGFRHKQMKNKLKNYNPNLSERENMLNNNWSRIYDCGKIRYINIC